MRRYEILANQPLQEFSCSSSQNLKIIPTDHRPPWIIVTRILLGLELENQGFVVYGTALRAVTFDFIGLVL